MPAEKPTRRDVTARELAKRYGLSTSTVKRTWAEPREDFLARAKARRDRAVELRAAGMKHREIAAEMDVPIGTVGRLLHEAKKLAAQEVAQETQAS